MLDNYTWWIEKVECYLGEELPPAKYVWFFDIWFHEKKSPRFAATYFKMISGVIQ